MKCLLVLITSLVLFNLFTVKVSAVYDPMSTPNNKFGIHLIQATHDESSPAAELVNSSGGDWGYVTVLIESKDRKEDKWNNFFNDLRRRHLIPLVRLATQPEGEYWKRPYEGEEQAWADFLDNLNWPTKNRYVIVYNEPNHAQEWGNQTDPKLYAKVLDKTITALKNKNRNFFVLNAGFDASTPHQPPKYMDQYSFMQQMNEEVPGIFEKLDGWVSHSYPNPEFSGSPTSTGRGTVRTWVWELQILSQLGIKKALPIFITETGWKHAEGLIQNNSYLSAEKVAEYYQHAFQNAWASSRIVSITPFLLSYQEIPFDHFSFKRISTDNADSTKYYPQYQALQSLTKTKGKPLQENKAQLESGEIYRSLVVSESYNISLRIKNIGQSIWNDQETVKLVAIQGGAQLGINSIEIPKEVKVEPGKEYIFNFSIKSPQGGHFKVVLNLFTSDKQFESKPFEFETEVKSPVILKVKSSLKWKGNKAGNYLLKVVGAVGETVQNIILNPEGESEEIEARYLLPDYTFDFTLSRPYYHPITIKQKVSPGINILDFGILQPNLFPALINPSKLWELLPFTT